MKGVIEGDVDIAGGEATVGSSTDTNKSTFSQIAATIPYPQFGTYPQFSTYPQFGGHKCHEWSPVVTPLSSDSTQIQHRQAA